MNKYSTSKYISTLNNISYEFDPCCNSLKNQTNPLRNNPNEVVQFLNKNNGNFQNVISCPLYVIVIVILQNVINVNVMIIIMKL